MNKRVVVSIHSPCVSEETGSNSCICDEAALNWRIWQQLSALSCLLAEVMWRGLSWFRSAFRDRNLQKAVGDGKVLFQLLR